MSAGALPPDPRAVGEIVARALDEDRAWQDVTTRALVPPEQQGRGVFLFKQQGLRQEGVVCGLDVVREVFAQMSAPIATLLTLEISLPDGSAVAAGQSIAVVSGPLAPMLSAERVALNFLQRLSGVATLTRSFVRRAAEGGASQLLDTRKTTPGLRELERYAVRVGGARNHRDTLQDGVLIKDNHIAAAAQRGIDVAELVRQARAGAPHTLRVEVEADDEQAALVAVEAGADVVLLDNMSPSEMRRVVESCGRDDVLFEASGGITLETVREVAASGVHLISAGALTHSAPALDISLDIEAAP